jgi:hypothetical protein
VKPRILHEPFRYAMTQTLLMDDLVQHAGFLRGRLKGGK